MAAILTENVAFRSFAISLCKLLGAFLSKLWSKTARHGSCPVLWERSCLISPCQLSGFPFGDSQNLQEVDTKWFYMFSSGNDYQQMAKVVPAYVSKVQIEIYKAQTEYSAYPAY